MFYKITLALQFNILYMISLKRHFLLLMFLGLLFSCSKTKEQFDLTSPVVRMDFSDELLLEGSVEAVNSTFVTCPDVYNSTIVYIVEDGTWVNEGDTVCILDNHQLVNQMETLQRLYDLFMAEFSKGRANLEMNYALLQAQVRNNETQKAINNLDSLQLKYYTPSQKKIAEIRLEISEIESNKLNKKLEALEVINRNELRKIELQITQADQVMNGIRESLKKLILLAPKSGMALRGDSDNSNGKLQEGESVYPQNPLVVIPDPDHVRVKIQAGETAYKRLAVGQRVQFSFDGMPGNYAYGTITMKSPQGYTLNRNSRVKFFDVLASVDSSHSLPSAGLSANCRVYLNHLKDTLVVPSISVFQEDSIQVVYVKKASGYVRQEVGIALQSSKEAVIACGLRGGENIALLQPPASKIKAEVLLDCEERKRYKPRKNDSIPELIQELPNETKEQIPRGIESTDIPEEFLPL